MHIGFGEASKRATNKEKVVRIILRDAAQGQYVLVQWLHSFLGSGTVLVMETEWDAMG